MTDLDRPAVAQDLVRVNWRKSSYSGSQGNCVEVADLGDQVAVRHSKDPNGPVLHFTRDEMLAFLQGAKASEFDDLA